ncbi:hypothetical protein [Bradyrhizobium sp. SRS-191]|uniref:hypothetical protein n=1 Tax=Bradyrhizobium sp. SRS-191 TaxID=2962606 RepID=UPI00211DBAA7|nr:hypothetical protein [Bradyrhizobium sp. SRS-191]
MFELVVLTAICCIAAVAVVTFYQRRQDVLYGPYIEDIARSPALRDEGIEASSS